MKILRLLALIFAVLCLTDPVSAQEQPRYGGTLILATFADPGSLNPGLTTSVPTHIVTGPIFNGLVSHDLQLAPVPDLAGRWSVSPADVAIRGRSPPEGREAADRRYRWLPSRGEQSH